MRRFFFNREFDFATFTKDRHNQLILNGFEVKGYTRAKEGQGYKPPPFGEGLDQAVILLDQGADNSFLVLNEPKGQEQEDLKRICKSYLPCIGLIFLGMNEFFKYGKSPESKNYKTDNEKKRKMLRNLLASPICSDIRMRDWCKSQEF